MRTKCMYFCFCVYMNVYSVFQMGSSFHLRDLVRNDETLLNRLHKETFSVTDRNNPLTTCSNRIHKHCLKKAFYCHLPLLVTKKTIAWAENTYKIRLH